MRFIRPLIDLLRGGAIGVVEVIPGVSGGTIALIIGVYDDLIDSAGHLVRAVVRGAADTVRRRKTRRGRDHLAQVKWSVVIPVGIGMLTAIFLASALVAPLIDGYPVETRALFAGLIVASIAVPARMVGRRWKAKDVVIALLAAAAAFAFTSIPPVDPVSPPLFLVAIAAAVAVCALVVPGLSGSFILLTVGMYAPTLAAVNDRDVAYLGVFVLGAVIGLSLFVSTLQWLLEHRRAITLVIMTGLMSGSLRALWPWQGEKGELQAPGTDLVLIVSLFGLGIVIVSVLLVVESVLIRRKVIGGEDPLPEVPAEPDSRAAASEG